MSNPSPSPPLPQSEIVLYHTADGRTRVECRFEDETLWLTQKLMAELFQKDVRTVNEHLKNIIAEGELAEEAVVREFRISRPEGQRKLTLLAEPKQSILHKAFAAELTVDRNAAYRALSEAGA